MGTIVTLPMLRRSSTGIQEGIILLAVFLTPFFSTIEVIGLLDLNVDLSGVDMWMLKVPKDILVLASILVGAAHGYWRDSPVSLGSFVLLSITVVASVAVSAAYMPLEAFAAGFRWLSPIAFYLTLGRLRGGFFVKMSRLLQLLLGIAIALQLYQLLFMAGYYGQTQSGFSVRNPGFYLFPSTMAAFAMATLYFTTRFEASRKRRVLVHFATILSVGLTASGTGVVSLALFTMSLLGKREHVALRVIAATGIGISAVLLLPALTNRDDIMESLATRIGILLEQMDISTVVFSKSFGAGTNVLVALVGLQPDRLDKVPAIIADSMISASILNAGFLFLVVVAYEIFVRPSRAQQGPNLLYLCTFLPFYITTGLFESFPVNILMFLALSTILSTECAPDSCVLSVDARASG